MDGDSPVVAGEHSTKVGECPCAACQRRDAVVEIVRKGWGVVFDELRRAGFTDVDAVVCVRPVGARGITMASYTGDTLRAATLVTEIRDNIVRHNIAEGQLN